MRAPCVLPVLRSSCVIILGSCSTSGDVRFATEIERFSKFKSALQMVVVFIGNGPVSVIATLLGLSIADRVACCNVVLAFSCPFIGEISK